MDDEAAIFAELEQLGEDEVRHRLDTNQFSLAYYSPAKRWIARRDRAESEESERKREASQSEQISIARSAKDAAWAAALAARKANIIASAALIMATISIVVSVIAILTHHSS